MNKPTYTKKGTWICPKCCNTNTMQSVMCSAVKCNYINPDLNRGVTSISSNTEGPLFKKLEPKRRPRINKYRPIIDLKTGKGYRASESYAQKLVKKGTHRLAGAVE